MRHCLSLFAIVIFLLPAKAADPLSVVGDVEGQPLGQNADRIAKALEFLGTPLPADVATALSEAVAAQDAKKLQQLLDPRALLQVTINPESRVKVATGPGSTSRRGTAAPGPRGGTTRVRSGQATLAEPRAAE